MGELDTITDIANVRSRAAPVAAIPGMIAIQNVGGTLKQVNDQGVATDIGGTPVTAPVAPGFDTINPPGAGNIYQNTLFWSYRSFSGGSSPDGAVNAAGIPGAVRCKTAAGVAFSDVYKNTDAIVYLGSGKWRAVAMIALDTVPSANLLFWSGFRDGGAGYGVFFYGDAHANIQCVTEDAGGTVTIDSGVAWVPTVDGQDGKYYVLDVVVQDGIATFSINGSQVATSSTHVPTTAVENQPFHVQPQSNIAAVSVYTAYERLRWDPST